MPKEWLLGFGLSKEAVSKVQKFEFEAVSPKIIT
jgi:hypothetical protein